MKEVIFLRYGELYLKGNNRGVFERLLLDNVKKKLIQYNCIRSLNSHIILI